jgi:head-tail adaptor
MSARPFIGRMLSRVTLQTPASTIEASGFQSRVYTNSSSLWAHIRSLRMAARFGADRQEAVVTHLVTFRALADFKAGCRFVEGARIYEALSFEDCEGAPGFMRAFCEEVRS